MEDWRIESGGDVVRGRTFRFRRYEPPSAAWDHDHCELCMAKFMQSGADGSLEFGYATPDEGSDAGFRWVCEACWNDLREPLGMRLTGEEGAGR